MNYNNDYFDFFREDGKEVFSKQIENGIPYCVQMVNQNSTKAPRLDRNLL